MDNDFKELEATLAIEYINLLESMDNIINNFMKANPNTNKELFLSCIKCAWLYAIYSNMQNNIKEKEKYVEMIKHQEDIINLQKQLIKTYEELIHGI